MNDTKDEIYVNYPVSNGESKPSDKLKIFLTSKIYELEHHIKSSKRKNIMYGLLYGTLITVSIIGSTVICIIAGMAFPPIVIAIISSVSAVSTAFSFKLNLKSRKSKLSKAIKKLNTIKDKLDYVIACNGELSANECNEILEKFREI